MPSKQGEKWERGKKPLKKKAVGKRTPPSGVHREGNRRGTDRSIRKENPERNGAEKKATQRSQTFARADKSGAIHALYRSSSYDDAGRINPGGGGKARKTRHKTSGKNHPQRKSPPSLIVLAKSPKKREGGRINREKEQRGSAGPTMNLHVPELRMSPAVKERK